MNRIILRPFTILYLTIGLILFSTCGNPDAVRESDGTALPDSTLKDLSGKTIGLSMYTLGAPYFAAMAKSFEQRVKALGMDFISMDAQDDILRQVGTVEDLLAQGIDLLILNPLDPHALIMVTKTATKANVPVIIVDSSIDPGADYITTIQSNNLRNGELVGEWLVKKMGDEPIKAAVMSGAQGNPVGKARRSGMFLGIIEQQFRTYGRATVDFVAQGWGNWTYEGGLTAMEDILVAHSDINVLISEQDAMAMGALQAITEAGKKDDILIVAGADGQKEAFELIKKGEYGATGLNNPVLIAEMAVEIACKVLAGERDFPEVIYTPAVCITKENVDEYYDPDAIF
jgi:ribose transport system substrate-binding protein